MLKRLKNQTLTEEKGRKNKMELKSLSFVTVVILLMTETPQARVDLDNDQPCDGLNGHCYTCPYNPSTCFRSDTCIVYKKERSSMSTSRMTNCQRKHSACRTKLLLLFFLCFTYYLLLHRYKIADKSKSPSLFIHSNNNLI